MRARAFACFDAMEGLPRQQPLDHANGLLLDLADAGVLSLVTRFLDQEDVAAVASTCRLSRRGVLLLRQQLLVQDS
jgi:ATP sulfurylase